MSNITCPLCGSPIQQRGFFGRGKPFCVQCGWNLQRAESALKEQSRASQFILVAFGILAITFAWLVSSANRGNHAVPAVAILAIFALAGGLPLWSYFSAKRAIALARATPSMQGAQVQPVPDAFLQRIQSLPRPRRVRFRFPGTTVAVVVVAFAMLFGVMFFGTARVRPPAGAKQDAPFRISSF